LIQKNFHKDFPRQHTNRTSAQERGLFFHTIFTNRCGLYPISFLGIYKF
jgi:hypothetical protein